MRTALASVVVLSLIALASRPTCEPQSPVGATSELTLDDVGPGGGDAWEAVGAPIAILHPQALVVRAVDFDGDGFKDILLGGNAGFGVRISYLTDDPTWHVAATEVLHIDDVYACYDVAVGDVNDDLLPDIVVGRRLGTSYVAAGERDAVFLHKSTSTQGDCFDTNASFFLPNPDTYGETFSVKLQDVTGDAVPELFTAGNYGIRYHRRNGVGQFDLVQTYCDQDNCGAGLGGYRSMAFGDLLGNGNTDLVAARMNGKHTRVYAWQNTPNDPFAPSTKDLAFPTAVDVGVRLQCGQFAQIGSIPGEPSNFGVELGDLDGDGELDVVTSYLQARNAVYRNDGAGGLTSTAPSPSPYPVSYMFAPITPNFVGRSRQLDYFYTQTGVGSLPAAPAGCYYRWTFPGALVNHCTDVNLADVNLDGKLDAAFSNRNELHDYFDDQDYLYGPCGQPGFPCLPDCYDHLFFNTSTSGSIAFDPCVELLGRANDGTGYGEYVDLNPSVWVDPDAVTDDRPDWLDANFSNVGPGDDGKNRMWWGLSLALRDCSQLFENQNGADPLHVDLSLATRFAHTGKTWRVLGSATSMRPLGTDALWAYLWNGGTPLYTGTVSWGQASPSLSIPLSVIPPSTTALFFQIEIVDGSTVVETTNPVRASLVSPP